MTSDLNGTKRYVILILTMLVLLIYLCAINSIVCIGVTDAKASSPEGLPNFNMFGVQDLH
jgi:hypothetical protein